MTRTYNIKLLIFFVMADMKSDSFGKELFFPSGYVTIYRYSANIK